METVFNEIQHSVKNWWASLLLGIVYIIVALWLMFAPLSSYVALSIVFSISMLISGILEILFAVSNRKGVPSWGWYIVGGIIDVILGIYLIAYPMVSMEVIPFIIAFWLMFRGFSSTGYSIDLKRYGTRDWGWYMTFGILAILCSLLPMCWYFCRGRKWSFPADCLGSMDSGSTGWVSSDWTGQTMLSLSGPLPPRWLRMPSY